ncbi:hypothetical protein Pla52n_39120 [Stieleria varia]|uniref:Uncharacterized protein n=1 Tax=Stieleria varia TaxID=2528005 RepID=A0A5C6AUZ5_9BACT|nr:hypothetical protein Pla52n_39120 [Stieleria varia]
MTFVAVKQQTENCTTSPLVVGLLDRWRHSTLPRALTVPPQVTKKVSPGAHRFGGTLHDTARSHGGLRSNEAAFAHVIARAVRKCFLFGDGHMWKTTKRTARPVPHQVDPANAAATRDSCGPHLIDTLNCWTERPCSAERCVSMRADLVSIASFRIRIVLQI